MSRFSSIHFNITVARKSFVIPKTSLYIDSLNRGSTVLHEGGLTCLKYTVIIPKVLAEVT